MNLFDLTGKVAIVTGSPRGVGPAVARGLAGHGAEGGVSSRHAAARPGGAHATAEALADHGAKVVISSRKAAACQEVADAIDAKHGAGPAIVVPASISSKEELQALVDETRKQLGRIDILVCNAASNPYY